MNSIKPAIEELERVYAALAPLFGREMPMPVITVQSKGRKNAWGWHARKRWKNADPRRLAEINLSAEHLGRPVEETAATMLHEMVHHPTPETKWVCFIGEARLMDPRPRMTTPDCTRPTGPAFRVTLRAVADGGPPAVTRLKRFLKCALRAFGLRCTAVEEVRSEPSRETPR